MSSFAIYGSLAALFSRMVPSVFHLFLFSIAYANNIAATIHSHQQQQQSIIQQLIQPNALIAATLKTRR
jgi:hypothetical protein